MLPLNKPTIGFLFISTPRFHDLGEGTEGNYFYMRKENYVKQFLKRFSFADVCFPGIVYTREDLKKAMASFLSSAPDLIFAMFLSWSDDYAWVRFLRDMPPIPLVLATISFEEEPVKDSFTEDRFVEFLASGGLVGSLEASGSLARFNGPMTFTFTGSEDQVVEETLHLARACVLRREIKNTVFGLLPSFNEVMWSTYIDPYAFFMAAGPELRFLSVAQLEEEIDALSAETVDTAVSQLRQTYSDDGRIQEDKMRASVAASLAMESLARKFGIELLVLNDVDATLLNRIGLRPGFAPCPGTNDVMVIPEGDLGGGLACYILGKLSGKHVNFIEPFYINRKDNTFAAGHAGPQDYTSSTGRTLLSLDERFAKSSYKYAGAPFAWHLIGPGEKTMLHISQGPNGIKMAATLVDALECDYFLAGYSHGLIRPRMDSGTFFSRLIEFGVTQHFALADGNWLKEASMAARLMGFDYLEI